MDHYGATSAWVVSNRDYTEQAYTLAKSNGVRLVNREQLIEMILAVNPAQSVSKPVSAVDKKPPVVPVAATIEEPDDLECPKCGYLLVKRKGKRGEFYGCSNFPKCRHTLST
ncbi:hypothetical protein PAT3040_04181 [Paenibacillus agaridevorans]|uniref:DNA topoisomerase type IA zn finger domain-containing protein n=2 Tax=Paenibacillus agaridevorans TaxID=171404 RepID=A0A2R5F1B5_9BACL|nr:hypothetical protein PAT3040_04181 [Paenibacillus agaridevorans]